MDKKYSEACISCRPVDKAEADRTILTTEHCRVVLRIDDQAWLGRCIILPKRHVNSFEQLTREEHDDIYACRAKVCEVYKKLFGMTYDNWAQLGNLTRDHEGKETDDARYSHIHYHLIPRYRKPAVWNNQEFTDVQFGKPLNIDPNAGHKKLVMTHETLLELQKTIAQSI